MQIVPFTFSNIVCLGGAVLCLHPDSPASRRAKRLLQPFHSPIATHGFIVSQTIKELRRMCSITQTVDTRLYACEIIGAVAARLQRDKESMSSELFSAAKAQIQTDWSISNSSTPAEPVPGRQPESACIPLRSAPHHSAAAAVSDN